MFSTDDGQTWRPLQLNLPTVAVHDLVVKDDDLVVAHARPVAVDPRRPAADPRVSATAIAGEPLHLFPPADAVRWRYGSSNWGTRGGYPESAARRVDLLLR